MVCELLDASVRRTVLGSVFRRELTDRVHHRVGDLAGIPGLRHVAGTLVFQKVERVVSVICPQALIGASDNPELVEAYARVAGRVRALRYRYTKTLDEVQSSQAAHRRLVDHLKANDLAAAVMVLRDHVYASLRNFTRRHTPGQGGVGAKVEET